MTTSTEFFSRQIKAGVYMTLDRKKLPNWKNLDPHILAIEAGFDPGNLHAVPYMHSINGFAYNVDMIKERIDVYKRQLLPALPQWTRRLRQLSLQWDSRGLSPRMSRRAC